MANDKNIKHALVTGATGYIGSCLCKYLFEKNWQISALVRNTSDLSPLKAIQENTQIYIYDGSIGSIEHTFKNKEIKFVFHLAAYYPKEHTSDDIEKLLGSNILLGTQLLEMMRKYQVKYIVNTGTYWQYYESKPIPVNLYAATKTAFQNILTYYASATHLKSINLLLFDTYGPNDPRKKLFTLLHNSFIHKKRLEMSEGEQLMDLVYIDDILKAYETAANLLLEGNTPINLEYTVSSGKPIPLKTLVDTICEITSMKIDIAWGGRPYFEREVMIPWSHGKTLPSWKPRVSLEEGIKKWWNSKSE